VRSFFFGFSLQNSLHLCIINKLNLLLAIFSLEVDIGDCITILMDEIAIITGAVNVCLWKIDILYAAPAAILYGSFIGD
jgi:hypothetical protein